MAGKGEKRGYGEKGKEGERPCSEGGQQSPLRPVRKERLEKLTPPKRWRTYSGGSLDKKSLDKKLTPRSPKIAPGCAHGFSQGFQRKPKGKRTSLRELRATRELAKTLPRFPRPGRPWKGGS